MKLQLECALGHKWKMEIGEALQMVECPTCHHYAVKLSGKAVPFGAVIKSIAKGKSINDKREKSAPKT